MSLTVLPIRIERREKEFDLFETITEALKKNGFELKEGDVLVISSKFISNSQGRVIELDSVKASRQSHSISKKFRLRPQIAEIIIRESDKIFGGIAGFVIASSDNILAPNAGIDRSNAKNGSIILYPFNPYLVAEQLRRKIFLKYLVHVGVIIVDSRLMPSRVGTTGIAIACSGIEPVHDMRSKKDLDGNPLKVTFQAIVDNLASIANMKMGEGSESKPIAVVRDSEVKLTDRKISPGEVVVSHDQCVYVRGLRNSI